VELGIGIVPYSSLGCGFIAGTKVEDAAGAAKEKLGDKATGAGRDLEGSVKSKSKEVEGEATDAAKDTSAKGLGSTESDITKKIDSDVLRTDEFLAIGDHVKSVDEEVGDVLRDMVGNAFGATKEKVNEAGENLEEKTEAARKEASTRANVAKA
jgi:hypothetical protein